MRLNSKQISAYTGGTIVVNPLDASKLACGISWDSRSIGADDLFVALPGEHHDGHDFVDNALREGACIVLVSQRPREATCLLAQEMGAAIIEVSNTFSAINDLAQAWRKHLRGRIIALTGSTGKTTTKDLIKTVLQTSFSVVATEGNQNNELGVPITILTANPETEFVVVEMGMRGLGQIVKLCELVKPEMGLITNVGESHVELLGTQENIARAKAELIACLPSHTGTAFLNSNDGYTNTILEVAEVAQRLVKTVFFDGSGRSENEILHTEDVYASDVLLDSEGKPSFTLNAAGQSTRCTLNLRGYHNVHNATAAAAVGLSLGLDIETIAQALSQAEPAVGRQRVLQTREGVTVIDDAYNASPDSMRASLAMFSALSVAGKRVAVLGDMGELGDYAQACHEGIGQFVASLDVDRLICIGDLSRYIASSAIEAGMASARVSQVSSLAEVLKELDSSLESGDVVLVKASHFMGLDRIVEGLVY